AGIDHRDAARLPVALIGHIEHQQILGRRRRYDRMQTAVRELEMKTLAGYAQHHAIEAFVILELAESLQVESGLIHDVGASQIRHGPRDTKMSMHGQDSFLVSGQSTK